MTLSANGRADIVGSPIALGDFLPEKRLVVLNGNTYEAWVTTNHRYPRRIQAQLDKYNGRYQRAIEPLIRDRSGDNTPTEVEVQAAVDLADEAYQRFVTDSVMALVSGISEEEVELVDLDKLKYLLTELGYFEPDKVQPESKAEVKADASPLTGATSPDDSLASTRAIPTSDS